MKNLSVICIDNQMDFCESSGSLYVPNAENDVKNVANLINRLGKKITDINCTLDSHLPIHIAHGCWWKGRDGKNPPPFTLISVEDVENGTWRAARPSLQKWALHYVKTLKTNGRFSLVIWPQHCLIGSRGAALHPVVFDAIKNWSETNFGLPTFLTKGSNILTEHYGALEADVQVNDDPSTQLNIDFIKTLEQSDVVAFVGEATGFCVRNTLMQVVNNLSDITYAQKIKVLKDCMSGIPGFEQLDQDLWDFCQKNGIEVMTSVDFLA